MNHVEAVFPGQVERIRFPVPGVVKIIDKEGVTRVFVKDMDARLVLEGQYRKKGVVSFVSRSKNAEYLQRGNYPTSVTTIRGKAEFLYTPPVSGHHLVGA